MKGSQLSQAKNVKKSLYTTDLQLTKSKGVLLYLLLEDKEKKMKKNLIHVDAILNLYFISSILENLNQLADQTIFISHLC